MKSRVSVLSIVLLAVMLISFTPMQAQPAAASPATSNVCDWAQFIADVTVPDGTTYAPGASFVKTWRLKNIGSCTWSNSYSLVFVSGEKMGTTTEVPMPTTVAPGQTVDLTVNMVAPSTAGHYIGYWRLRNASGVLFGIGWNANSNFWVEINVNSSSTNVAYDFSANACSAVWSSGAGVRPCPGTDGDGYGFVLKKDNPQLENGASLGTTGLLTAPQNIYNGYIQGVYPAMTVQAGDRFQSIVNCEYGATACYVTFRLDYQIDNGPVQTFWTFREKYEGLYYRADLDLSSLAGKNVKFILTVLSSGYASGDRALWGHPVIVRPGATVPTATPIPGTPPTPTNTVPPSACSDKAAFVADVTVPDGSLYTAGTTFKKTWRLKNIGTCTWTPSYALVFSSGDQMGGAVSVAFPGNAAPGQTIDLSVDLTAPATAGSYRGYWKLKNANGALFGIGYTADKAFWVDIKVTGGSTSSGSYDFYANACSATWVSSAGTLPCPGTEGDARGFVIKQDTSKLENGTTTSSPGLVTFPQFVYNGYIQGIYPAYTVQSGDRFQSIVNCDYGATSCYVIFRLDYRIGSNPIQTYWAFAEKYEGQYYSADIDLSSLAGQNVSFILTVLAAGSYSGDRAVWVAPRIYRPGSSSAPAPTATFTPVTPTTTATSTPTNIPPTATFTSTPTLSSATDTPTSTPTPTETPTETPTSTP
jgi:hypothetical protein